MKKMLTVLLMIATSTAFAGVDVNRQPLGSGEPGTVGSETATPVMDGLLHTPQYMPGHPTAATIYPRVVDVPCTKAPSGSLQCDGYNWMPEMGRGEYLFVRPRMVETRPVVPITIIKEVPRKKKGE